MIEAKNIGKLYKIPHEKRVTFFETALGYIKDQLTYENFHALKNVSFSIKRGEMVGLIGKNGSGKTTLLKILGNIISPTEGDFKIEGKVAPLLSLAVGFHHELTAKENLYLYGAILGMTRKEMDKKIDEIFEVAGVARFKDTKLKNFSSGMTARLAFALMIQNDPDVLLLDEIFAVGDKDFIPQCLAVFEDYKKKGKTVLFASHDLEAVASNCDRTILLHNGEIKFFGPSRKTIEIYNSL